MYRIGATVFTTRELLHPSNHRPALPTGSFGTVIRILPPDLALVDFGELGQKAVATTALDVSGDVDNTPSLSDDLVCLVASQLDEVRRLQAALSDSCCAAPPRLAATPVPVETVTLPGSSRLLAEDMQREGWHRAETREDGTMTWYRLRRS